MGWRIKEWSLVPRGIRYKLLVGFGLMSVIPLLVMGFLLVNYVFPHLSTIWDVSLVVGITTVIACLGYVVVRQMVEPIVRLSLNARQIVRGEFHRSVEVTSEDEVGELARAMNLMTRHVRDQMEELRLFSHQTQELNASISKKVLTLSGLLQVGNLISQGAPFDELLDVVADKLGQVEEQHHVLLLLELEWMSPTLVWRVRNMTIALEQIPLPVLFDEAKAHPAGLDLTPLVVDVRASRAKKGLAAWCETVGMAKVCLLPILVRGKVRGVLFVGSSDGVGLKDDDVEIYRLLAKQVAIATENDYLTRRTKELEIRDELTGLYNAKYLHQRLEEEIERGMKFQRPCAFLLFGLHDVDGYRRAVGDVEAERTLKQLAKLFEAHATEVDRVGRLRGDTFAMILPERNKREAEAIGETIRHAIEDFAKKRHDPQHLGVSVGVSENPLDGASAEALLEQAERALLVGQAPDTRQGAI